MVTRAKAKGSNASTQEEEKSDMQDETDELSLLNLDRHSSKNVEDRTIILHYQWWRFTRSDSRKKILKHTKEKRNIIIN